MIAVAWDAAEMICRVSTSCTSYYYFLVDENECSTVSLSLGMTILMLHRLSQQNKQ